VVINRIVSFLPSATELLYELGVKDKIFGVTHECNYPEDAKSKPRVISSVFDPNLISSKEIDEKIVELARIGQDIYKLNETTLLEANPDLIISQDVCEVCSAHINQVDKAMSILTKKPEVQVLDPHDLDDILSSIMYVAKKIGTEKEGKFLRESLQQRILSVKNVRFAQLPTVLCLEWLDPFFTSGHWIPEMVEFAGAKNLISKKGESSKRISIEKIIEVDPDIIVLMPCGFEIPRIVSDYKKILDSNPRWKNLRAVKNKKIFAVNANSYFSKPSIRTITGLEILAKLFHPELFSGLKIPQNSLVMIKV
jgi:iron complex transport system substrate-binding protein